MRLKRAIWLVCFGFFGAFSFAQEPLAEVEARLAKMADSILNDDSLSTKIRLNKEFTSLLIKTLERPDSYDYPFSTLKTISILQPEDRSFRIFTWYIVDKNYREFYGEQYHYYFGLVQRRQVQPGSPPTYKVIPLIEMPRLVDGIENTLLSSQNWLGALYYPPKYESAIPSFTRTIYDRVSQPGKVIKRKQTFYLLFGWNGMDNRSNLKLIDVMSFDLNNPDLIIFGADMFFFDPVIPKFRAVFRYSEYAPFSLNFGYVKAFLGQKKLAIVYDHLGTPKGEPMKMEQVIALGPDGSYDALVFANKRRNLIWYKNVELADDYMSRQHRKEVEANRDRILQERAAAGDPTVTGTEADFNPKKEAKALEAQLKEQRKAEAERLKAAGIKPVKIK